MIGTVPNVTSNLLPPFMAEEKEFTLPWMWMQQASPKRLNKYQITQ